MAFHGGGGRLGMENMILLMKYIYINIQSWAVEYICKFINVFINTFIFMYLNT